MVTLEKCPTTVEKSRIVTIKHTAAFIVLTAIVMHSLGLITHRETSSLRQLKPEPVRPCRHERSATKTWSAGKHYKLL